MVRKEADVPFTGTDGEIYMEKWDPEKVKNNPVLAHGWAKDEGYSNPHFGVSAGFLLEVSQKLPELVLYTFQNGDRETPVIDAIALCQDILETYCTAKGLEPKTLRIATSKVSKATKLVEEIGMDDATLEAIRGANPEAYNKIVALMKVKK